MPNFSRNGLACGLALLVCSPLSAANLLVSDLSPGDLLVTEYLADPADVSDAANEYFEIFNPGRDAINLEGLTIRDEGSNQFEVTGLVIDAGAFLVFSNGDGSGLGIDVDFQYGSSMALTNSADEIVLTNTSGPPIFSLQYTDGNAFGSGVAHELKLARSGIVGATGPAGGLDYQAATLALGAFNFGSPGLAGATMTASPIPLPSGLLLLASAFASLTGGRWLLLYRAMAAGGTRTNNDLCAATSP